MTDTTPLTHRPLPTDSDLQRLLGDLLRSAVRRQLWFIFMDEDHRVAGPLMPCADLPDDPYEPTETADLGTHPVSVVLARRLSMIGEVVGASRVVLVWERTGAASLTANDREWARALADGCREVGMPLRAQFLLHDRGVAPVALDDLL
jgi:hypothetical protein